MASDVVVDLVPVAREEKSILGHLMQLYIHDLTEIDGADVEANGLYDYKYIKEDQYWSEPGWHPFFIKVAGQFAGFALVSPYSDRESPNVHCVSEFFVMRKYRRHGVGRKAALALFSRFHGSWEVAEMKGNTGAILFWRRVIAEFTGGTFQEDMVNNHLWEGPIQSFVSSPKR
jgi:predicted acetyltransferase